MKGTLVKVTFGGNASITIPAGQEIWSDAAALPFIHGANDPAIQGRNLAVSYLVILSKVSRRGTKRCWADAISLQQETAEAPYPLKQAR